MAKVRSIRHGDGSCTQHKMMGCPQSCWKVGRTLILKYDGKLSSGRTFDTPEAATARLHYEATWTARQVAAYEAKGLPVPSQFSRWEKVIWDGANHK